jgi:hypothetical protein
MVQRGRWTTLAERAEIGGRWQAKQTDGEISAAMGRSYWTVRKWRRKFERGVRRLERHFRGPEALSAASATQLADQRGHLISLGRDIKLCGPVCFP